MLIYASSQHTYYPCSLLVENQTTKILEIQGGVLSNGIVASNTIYFQLDQPTTKGTLKLYIDALKIVVTDADNNNYITSVVVYGQDYSGVTAIPNASETTDRKSANTVGNPTYETTFTAADCSAFESIVVAVAIVTDTANALDFLSPQLRIFYA